MLLVRTSTPTYNEIALALVLSGFRGAILAVSRDSWYGGSDWSGRGSSGAVSRAM